MLKAYCFSNQRKKYVAGVHRITINLIFRNYLCGKKSGSYTSLYELHSCKSFAIQHWFVSSAQKIEQHKYLNPGTGCPFKVAKCKNGKLDSARGQYRYLTKLFFQKYKKNISPFFDLTSLLWSTVSKRWNIKRYQTFKCFTQAKDTKT